MWGYDWCLGRARFLDFFLLVFSENDLAISKSFFLVAVGNNRVVRKGWELKPLHEFAVKLQVCVFLHLPMCLSFSRNKASSETDEQASSDPEPQLSPTRVWHELINTWPLTFTNHIFSFVFCRWWPKFHFLVNRQLYNNTNKLKKCCKSVEYGPCRPLSVCCFMWRHRQVQMKLPVRLCVADVADGWRWRESTFGGVLRASGWMTTLCFLAPLTI